ncbi:MAG: hypothetical protein KDB53_05675 [Planctomycetes bacterium]|nr:hypothetical protein [Planctomycetota bacterium]
MSMDMGTLVSFGARSAQALDTGFDRQAPKDKLLTRRYTVLPITPNVF